MECACACSFGNFTLLSRNPTSSPPTFLTKLRFLILNRSSSFDRHNNNLLIRKACGSDENRSSNGFSIAPNKIFNEEAIGAEYGEGFETFRPDGPLKVDVDFLNDRLQESFLQRIRYAMKPDEAYGLIFSLDNVVADTRALKLNTWKQLASEEVQSCPILLILCEVNNEAAVLGFVGAPFTLASYVVEGGSSKHFTKIKRLAFSQPKVLHALLQKFATSMAKYIRYQADNGAQAVQIFDSWATELSPEDFEEFSLPYLKQIVDSVKQTHPSLPLILYASGSGGLLERLPLTGVDVVSLDWTVDMADGRRLLGADVAVQGNVDPGVLSGSKDFITSRINDTVQKAGK